MKQRIVNYLLRHLLNAITIDEIISNHPKTGDILIDGKLITANEVKQLHAEIKALEGFRIWEIMSKTTKHMAEEKIFNKSVVIEDIQYGKAMLYNLSLMNSILEVIKKKTL